MTYSWSDPRPIPENTSPYVHWWMEFDDKRQESFQAKDYQQPFAQMQIDAAANSFANDLTDSAFGGGHCIPIPAHSDNENFRDSDWTDPVDLHELPDDIPEDTVLVGIVDTGISLSNRRFQFADGRTRFIAAWQQSATFGGQRFLPFGQELYQDDINRLMDQNRAGAAFPGDLDEDQFNRDARLVEPALRHGQRDLEFSSAHGTHVLDLAAGLDPTVADAADLSRCRLIAVNMPPQKIHGTAGSFLEFWAAYGVERIIRLADALWERNRARYGDTDRAGYPLVINFSFGKHAGRKDGKSAFETGLADLIESRAAPTSIVMPVGNANLDRGHARALMGRDPDWAGDTPQPELIVPWRLLPADKTSNFVEVWTRVQLYDGQDLHPEPQPQDFEFAVGPPGTEPVTAPELHAGHYADLRDADGAVIARLYCARDSDRAGFVICTQPTMRLQGPAPEAPAGLWHLRLTHTGAVVNTDFYVQTDQAGLRASNEGLRSRFDFPNDEHFLENGHVRDSFDYHTRQPTDSWDIWGEGQIKGTQNALATHEEIITIGGYRVSDGEPAVYSGSNDGHSKRGGGQEIIDACYPSEDAPSLFGLLAAGAKTGSVVALRGTSMSAALATRDIAAGMMRDVGMGLLRQDENVGLWVRQQAEDYRNGPRPAHYTDLRMLKGGVGHRPYPSGVFSGRVPRM